MSTFAHMIDYSSLLEVHLYWTVLRNWVVWRNFLNKHLTLFLPVISTSWLKHSFANFPESLPEVSINWFWTFTESEKRKKEKKNYEYFKVLYLLKSQLTFTFLKSTIETHSKLTIKTLERHHWCRSGVLIVNSEHVSHIFLVFLLLILNK